MKLTQLHCLSDVHTGSYCFYHWSKSTHQHPANVNVVLEWLLSDTSLTFLHLKQQKKNINMAMDGFCKWPQWLP